MKKKKESKEKLEQRKQRLTERMEEIKKFQVELMLKNILLGSKLNELDEQRTQIESQLKKIDADAACPRQLLSVKDSFAEKTIILYMN